MQESARLTIDEVIKFWQRARVPNRQKYNCINVLKRLYDKYLGLKKGKNRPLKLNRCNEQVFCQGLEDLFDIAHANALSNPSVLKEDKEFLRAQREKGRRG